ncbi:LptF/LptG family permease [Mucilaginibacter myungsuensis]|uniref:LptF/LptG family permease n=1 Tax=Mucilaginibacter myungsuensis TaxID=649104 RepID=A0A929KWJ7_9SPHI|nr:LptF/LptG family permease [Mucilaginibacter myungsuensis]MBE9662487.1 LptF/LptG family permease [Mucilaginibacter myungsuensis]MDN3597906.1 LptF/LptG family permease [Mucilaginibacter myungsuensis]
MKTLLRRYFGTIDRYIIKKYLGTFAFTLAIFSMITVVFDISERLDNFLKNNAPLHDIIFEYYAGFVPFYLNMLSPLINFLAVIFFTAKMANQTEIVPILSGKASFNRFLWPYFVSSMVVFIVSFLANVYLIPYTNRLKNGFENLYFKDYDPTKSQVHIQLDKRTFVYMERYDEVTHTGYDFILEKFDGGTQMREKLTAQLIKYDSVKNTWSIQPPYEVRYVDGLKEKLFTSSNIKDTLLDMKPNDFVKRDNVYSAVSTTQLRKDIIKEELRGTGVLLDMKYEYYKRFVYPFSTFVLTLIGVSISSRKVRGGIGLPLGIGIFLCFAYIVVDKFAFVFSIKGGVPPALTVLMSNTLFGILGLYLLRKAPK